MRIALMIMTIAALLLPGISGCVVVDAIKEGIVTPPTAEVIGVSVVDASDRGTALEAAVRLSNANNVELPIESVRVRMSGPSGQSFTSDAPATVSMPPNGSQVLRVRGVLTGRSVGAGDLVGEQVAVSVSVRWIPPGEVRAILTESQIPLPVAVARQSAGVGQDEGGELEG
ncbi:MAG: hypothetical protein AAGF84_09630 [Planctomycetota bacterium]